MPYLIPNGRRDYALSVRLPYAAKQLLHIEYSNPFGIRPPLSFSGYMFYTVRIIQFQAGEHMRQSPLTAQEGLTFTDYFKLNIDIEEVLRHFGYTVSSQELTLPRYTKEVPWFADLHQRIQASLPYISLTSEAARREFLIAPILIDLARFNHVKVKVEFPLDVSNQLRGTIDYFIQAKSIFLVIEAKNADLQRGFIQLAAELIALDQWTEETSPSLYGAVSIGNVWQFGKLDRINKHMAQDLNLYRVPADLHELLQILLGILGETETIEG